MSDQIFGGHNFGDPDTSDPQFNMGNMVSIAAQAELSSFRTHLEKYIIQHICGPQTAAYYQKLYDLSLAQKAWGSLPPAPSSLDQ